MLRIKALISILVLSKATAEWTSIESLYTEVDSYLGYRFDSDCVDDLSTTNSRGQDCTEYYYYEPRDNPWNPYYCGKVELDDDDFNLK